MQIILDIIVAALIVIPMGIGMAKGLVYVAVRTLGWIGALAASFFAAKTISDASLFAFLMRLSALSFAPFSLFLL